MGWKARFPPTTIGRFEAVAVAKDTRGERRSPPVTFDCVPSSSKGFLRVSHRDPRFLEFSEGQPFFAIGQNLAFIGSGQYLTLSRAEETFGRLAANGANYLRIWTCCEDWALALEARKSAWDRSWSRRAPVVPMPDDPTRNCLRLTSTNAALEVNPSHPVALRPNTRYTVTGKARAEPGSALWLEVFDTTAAVSGSADSPGWHGFRHEFTTGPKQHWLGAMRFRPDGPGTAWLADLSLKDADGGPELLWEAELNRPTRGFYNPVDQWRITGEMKRSRSLVDVHNTLWASALSGASATALCWWWERMDERDVYPLYRSVSAFVADVPWTGGELRAVTLGTADERLRIVGLQATDRAWLWLFHRAAAWEHVVTQQQTPPELSDAAVELRGLPAGNYHLEWWDTRTSEILKTDQSEADPGGLRLVAPAFSRDLAVKVRRQ
jgi:hypothetical protein